MSGGRMISGLLGQLLHVIWEMCAVVGVLYVLGLADVRNPGQAAWVFPLGLTFGVLTSSLVVRPLRPKLERMFPGAFRRET